MQTNYCAADEIFCIYARYPKSVANGVNRYINCERTVCKNCHEMNLLIVKGLLTDCKNLVKQFFESETFSFEDSMRLKKMYDICFVYHLLKLRIWKLSSHARMASVSG